MNITHCNRRDFLKATGLTFSGLLLCFETQAQSTSTHAGKFSPNAYIGISKEAGVELWISKAEIGQNIRTAYAMILADELGADLSKVTLHQAGPRNDIGRQTTAASGSIRGQYNTLRSASATVRQMLTEAAAKRWNVSANACKTEMGFVLSGNRRMSFSDAAALAEGARVPSNASPRPNSELKYIGRATGSLDARDIVTGKTQFGSDALPENCAFAVVIRCPVSRGKLNSFNAKAAEAMPGVKNIFQFGDKIAVIADNTWNAVNAARAVEANWDGGRNARLSHDKQEADKRAGVRNPRQSIHSSGDFDGAYRSADKTFELEISVPTIAHACMEPPTSTAWMNNGRMEIWGSTQSLSALYDELPKMTGLPRDRVTYHQLRIGGGFGRKLDRGYIEEVIEIAKQVDYPVKMLFTREDDIQVGRYRTPNHFLFRAGLDRNGYPTAVAEASTKRAPNNKPSKITALFENTDFKIQNLPSGVAGAALRAPGSNITNFAEQCLLGRMASEAKIDPLDYLLAVNGDRQTLSKLRWQKGLSRSPEVCELLKLVKDQSGWKRDSRYGYGVATFSGYGSHIALVAMIAKTPGTLPVEKIFAAVNCGQVINPLGAYAQIEGGIIDGVSATLYQKITLQEGRVQQSNFHDYKLLRMNEHPEVSVHIVKSDASPQGLGEVSYPPVAGAIVNALHDSTGRWFTSLPLRS